MTRARAQKRLWHDGGVRSMLSKFCANPLRLRRSRGSRFCCEPAGKKKALAGIEPCDGLGHDRDRRANSENRCYGISRPVAEIGSTFVLPVVHVRS